MCGVVGIEARLGQRQGEERDALVGVLHQHLQRAADRVGARVERQLDRPGGEPLLEQVGGEVAGALVEEPRQHLRAAGLAGRVLGGAALSGIGFTVSLLIAELSFTDGTHTAAAKFAILAGSLISAVLGAVALRVSARLKRSRDMNRDGVVDVDTEPIP